MSSYLDYEGLGLYHENNKNYIDGKIPTKTSELTNDSNFVNTNTLNTSLNAKAPKEHTHEISDVDGLQDELDNYASKTDIPTLVAGSNITLTPNTGTNEITISSTGGGSGSVDTLEDLGVTATADELNYVDGVTSNIQTQLNAKANSSHTHSYLPLDGGTLTGQLIVKGTAASQPIMTRGISGSDGNGNTGDLYVQYNGEGNIMMGTSGKAKVTTEGLMYSNNKLVTTTIYSSTEPTTNLDTGTIWIG